MIAPLTRSLAQAAVALHQGGARGHLQKESVQDVVLRFLLALRIQVDLIIRNALALELLVVVVTAWAHGIRRRLEPLPQSR